MSPNCRTRRCRIISSAGFGEKAEGQRAGTERLRRSGEEYENTRGQREAVLSCLSWP